MPTQSKIVPGTDLSIAAITTERRGMSSNRSALDALAQEGIVMTEEQLLREAQKVPSNGNGSTPAPAKEQMAYNNGTSPSMTAVKAKPSSEGPQRGSEPSRPTAVVCPEATGEAQLVTRRGRQRTPKPWLMTVLCRLGIHRGPWSYLAEGDCTQGRECGRCGAVHVHTKHYRGWQYKREGSCSQIRVCTRCADVNKYRTKHEAWGDTYSIDSDTDAHECVRCGRVLTWSTASDGD